MPETYAYFYVAGFDCAPEEISKHLSLSPSRIDRRGDPYQGRKKGVREYSSWEIDSGLPRDSYDLGALVDSLADMLIARYDRFASLPSHASKGINCVGYYYYSENPGFHFSAELSSKVAKLGLKVDFDLYNLSEIGRNEAPEKPGEVPNQLSEPTLASGTSPAGQEPRLR
jgi:hypothetical protein